MKRLIIGDIQGCYTELLDLINKAALTQDDEIIAVGDIVDRGPDSPAVLKFFRTQPNARTVMGNHERKHVRSFRGLTPAALSQKITRRQFGEEQYPSALDYMDALPRFLELPEAVVVHAFFEPGVPLAEQQEIVIVGTIGGENYLQKHYGCPWYELYDGEKPLIVGHHDYGKTGKPFVYRDRVFAIDSGCCFGRALTGLLLPDFRLISVPSRADHWTEMQQQEAELWAVSTLDEALLEEDSEYRISPTKNLTSSPEAKQVETAPLSPFDEGGEQCLDDLFTYIYAEHTRVLAGVRAQCAFEELPAREQGSIYAATIGRTVLARWLHLARRGELTRDLLRAHFRQPEDLHAFVAQIGLASRIVQQEELSDSASTLIRTDNR